MPIRYAESKVTLEGVCTIEEVEGLIAFLERTPKAVVLLASCEHMHTAILQALLAYRVPLSGEVYSPFLWKWVAPLLARATHCDVGEEAC